MASPARPGRTATAALLLCACRAPKRALEGILPPPPDARPAVQSLVGASFLRSGDLVIDGVSTSEPGAFAEVGYSTLPAAGLSGMQPLTHGPVHLGLEGAVLFSGWAREADAVSTETIDVDTALWLTDLSFGPYVSTSMSRTVRFYAGAGAALLIGVLDVDSDALEGDLDDAAFDAGVYARAGLEVLLRDGSLFGLGVRGVRADLDFGGGLPDVSADALQVFVTFTLGSDPFFAPPAW